MIVLVQEREREREREREKEKERGGREGGERERTSGLSQSVRFFPHLFCFM